MIECLNCKTKYKNFTELSEHILNNESKHSRSSIKWATRFKLKLPLPKDDGYYRKSAKYYPKPKQKVNKNGEPICRLCHKPIGKQDSDHCCC